VCSNCISHLWSESAANCFSDGAALSCGARGGGHTWPDQSGHNDDAGYALALIFRACCSQGWCVIYAVSSCPVFVHLFSCMPQPYSSGSLASSLGKGNFVRVYLALDVTTGEMIVIKQVENSPNPK
jgi:hypothetical protein